MNEGKRDESLWKHMEGIPCGDQIDDRWRKDERQLAHCRII